MNNSSAALPWRVWMFLVLLSGCGPEPAALQGTVEYESVFVKEAVIRLYPLAEGRGKGRAALIADGKFQFTLNSGLVEGDYRIELLGDRLEKRKKEADPNAADQEFVPIFPEIYNVNSLLKVELKPGDNQLELRLSRHGVIAP